MMRDDILTVNYDAINAAMLRRADAILANHDGKAQFQVASDLRHLVNEVSRATRSLFVAEAKLQRALNSD